MSHRAILACVVASLPAAGQVRLPAPIGWPAPPPGLTLPAGETYAPPIDPTLEPAAGAPVIYELNRAAGPDQSFFMVGEHLAGAELFVWGRSAESMTGARQPAAVRQSAPGYLTATIGERAHDGLLLVWAGNEHGWSRPVRLNAPEIWWETSEDNPRDAHARRVFGRNLVAGTDIGLGLVACAADGGEVGTASLRSDDGGYSGSYASWIDDDVSGRIWAYAGSGGEYGWSEPVPLGGTVASPARLNQPPRSDRTQALPPGGDLQAAVDALAAAGGGQLVLGHGDYPFSGTLQVPGQVTIVGEQGGRGTRLVHQPVAAPVFARLDTGRWGQGPGRVHSPGDTMVYQIEVPRAGTWRVWLRYATEMSPWNQPGVSGKMTIQAEGGEPQPLEQLDNTGSFSAFRWSHAATCELAAGPQRLTWRNVGGGGINLDAMVLVADPAYQPTDSPLPTDGPTVVVIQAEDVVEFVTREGVLPGVQRAAIWLRGDWSGLRHLSIVGSPQTDVGVLLQPASRDGWLRGARVEGCEVLGIEGKQSENCGLLVQRAADCRVRFNTLGGRAPIFLRGAVRCWFTDNRLVPSTRFGGNAEAAITARTARLEECLIEDNQVIAPPRYDSGAPTARRLIWVATGSGSVTANHFAGNGVDESARLLTPHFGGVAGGEQNVGEMILFEANHRTMYFGPLVGGGADSVVLPADFEPTPDDRLGSVRRDQLPTNEAGREVPHWPSEVDDGGEEPPLGEYYVTIMSGVGRGQTRRVVRREATALRVDKPWRVPPTAGSVVCIGTGYYRNQVLGNHVTDGMSGIQLWISCIENVVAGNRIDRMRKPGFFLYSNGTTLASSMPRTWNRGISPLFWNEVVGNRTDECSAGALVTSGDSDNLAIEFPRALGNALRHNSFVRNRTEGVIIISRTGQADAHPSPSILGTVVEFNLVRDAEVAYRSSRGADGGLFRRNLAYFWYPVSLLATPPVAFQVDRPGADVAILENTVEGRSGGAPGDAAVIERRAE